MTDDKDIDWITGRVVDAAIKIHTRPGPGYPENIFSDFLGDPGVLAVNPYVNSYIFKMNRQDAKERIP